MDRTCKITVAGGDLRQAHLAGILAKDGFDVTALRLEKDVPLSDLVHRVADTRAALQESDVIILPLPVTTDGENVSTPFSAQRLPLDEILLYAKRDALLCGGMVSNDLQNRARASGLAIVDYLEREELAVKNAISTSEGAVSIAMQERPFTIFGSTCIITGFGRISKVLARMLVAMGAKVIVTARKLSDLAWAEIYGCEALHISGLAQRAGEADILFNTVPAMVLAEEELSLLRRDCLVIDLASKPGGAEDTNG